MVVINVLQIMLIWLWTFISATLGLIILPIIGQKRAIYFISQIWSGFIIAISGVKLVVEGKENIPKHKNVIYASNHESSFDIPILFKALPVPLFFLAKAELQKIPIFGWFMGAVGMVFVDRANHKNALNSLKRAGKEIKKGKDIISFPEGTRTRDGKMKLFRRGTFVLALECSIDIVPIAIVGSREVNPPGFRITPGVIKVCIGKPIDVNHFEKKKPDELALFVENLVKELRL